MSFNECLKIMKIRKVKWANHPILGNLELDFVNPITNKPFSTIVLAGENGTGKTTILETLNTFLSIGSFEPFDGIEYEVEDKRYILTPLNIPGSNKTFFTRYDVENNTSENIHRDKNNSPGSIHSDSKDPRSYGSVFSRPRADYKTSKIESVKTNELDKNKYDSDNDDNFTSLKQLIVDVQNQDNEQYRDINDKRNQQGQLPMSTADFEPISKIYRFKSAFNGFFETIKYKKVGNASGEKVVFFEKNGLEIPLDVLSTGEKQIVFRGAYLLRNINILKNSTIMIDEPELSMHPLWQKKILQYYRNLFTDGNSQQTAQLFFASHSEAVISEALHNLDNTKVIVLKRDGNGQVSANCIGTPAVLPYTLAAEVNYQAFELVSTDYHNALYGYIEAEGWKNNFDAQYPTVSYNRERNGTVITQQITLTEKIRHIIHHPENRHNSYTEGELKESIERMRSFIIAQP